MSDQPPLPSPLPAPGPVPSGSGEQRDYRLGDLVGTVVAWTVITACVFLIFLGNFIHPSGTRAARHPAPPPGNPPALPEIDARPAQNVELRLQSRLSIGLHELNKIIESAQPGVLMPARSNQNDADSAARIRQVAISPEDQVAAAPVLGALLGPGEGLKELDQIVVPASPAGVDLTRDIRDLRDLLGTDPEGRRLDEWEKARLRKRMGWNGELALTWRLPASDPARQSVINVAFKMLFAVVMIFGVVLVAAVAGLFLMVMAIIAYRKGRLRSGYLYGSVRRAPPLLGVTAAFPPPATFMPLPAPHLSYSGPPLHTDGPIWNLPVRGAPFVEAFAIYLAGQILISLLVHRFISEPSLGLEWLLAPLIVLAILWPRFRGIDAVACRRAIGWHTGRGALREMRAGLVGYLTGLPVFITGAFITLLLVTLTHAKNPTHPIQFQVGQGVWSTLQIYLLACIWAPIVEETMFRGMLFHHLRRFGRGWRWLFSAALVSFIFAAIHPQGWAAIPALGALAMVLAGIREWSGSIVGSMTAHCLQNFTAVTVMLLLMT